MLIVVASTSPTFFRQRFLFSSGFNFALLILFCLITYFFATYNSDQTFALTVRPLSPLNSGAAYFTLSVFAFRRCLVWWLAMPFLAFMDTSASFTSVLASWLVRALTESDQNLKLLCFVVFRAKLATRRSEVSAAAREDASL